MQELSELQLTRLPDGKILEMQQEFSAPIIGLVVLFTPPDPDGANGAREYVAIVGQVFHDPHNPRPYVNLLTFPPFQPPAWQGSVQEGGGPRSWRYIPSGRATSAS